MSELPGVGPSFFVCPCGTKNKRRSRSLDVSLSLDFHQPTRAASLLISLIRAQDEADQVSDGDGSEQLSQNDQAILEAFLQRIQSEQKLEGNSKK
jgi:hypothetical protein